MCAKVHRSVAPVCGLAASFYARQSMRVRVYAATSQRSSLSLLQPSCITFNTPPAKPRRFQWSTNRFRRFSRWRFLNLFRTPTLRGVEQTLDESVCAIAVNAGIMNFAIEA